MVIPSVPLDQVLPPMIRFSNANVTYPNGVSAMKDLDLQIDDGEFVVVVGLSGAGKSTLIRAINGLVPLTSGELGVNGHEVHDLSRAGDARAALRISA